MTMYEDRDNTPKFGERDILNLRLNLKDIPFEVLAEGKFSNYDGFATIIQNRIKGEIADLLTGR